MGRLKALQEILGRPTARTGGGERVCVSFKVAAEDIKGSILGDQRVLVVEVTSL